MSVQQIADILGAAKNGSVLTEPDAPAANLAVIGDCVGSKFHNPRPLSVRFVDLASVFVKGKVSDLVLLCSTCHDNLLVYLAVLDCYDGETPQAVRRSFGNLIRDLGDEAWSHYGGGHHA